MNYYQILKVSVTASRKDIKKAYRELAKQYHPDRNPGNRRFEEYFKKINEAYETLSDDKKRIMYDSILRENELKSRRQQNSHYSNGRTKQRQERRDRSNREANFENVLNVYRERLAKGNFEKMTFFDLLGFAATIIHDYKKK